MNKTLALLILGVILLAMGLVMGNQYFSTPPPPLPAGTATPLPQTGVILPAQPPVEQTQATPAPRTKTPEPKRSPLPQAPTPPQPLPQTPPQASAQTPAQTPSPAPQAAPAALSPVPAKEPAATPQAAPAATPAPEGKSVPARAPAPRVISRLVVFATQEGATVRMVGASPLSYKTLHLKNPERVVVDLNGTWTVKAPGVPPNKHVGNVRIGKQANGTRIVIDLKSAPGAVNFIKKNDKTLDVRIR